MNPQDQIAEIYEILKKQESRRKWNLVFIWTKRIIIWGIIVLLVFFPGKVLSSMSSFLMPMIQQAVEESFEKRKDAFADGLKNTKDSLIKNAKNLIK